MTESAEKLINWNELSKVLLEKDSRKTPIRKGEIPIKHKERVEQLGKYLHRWLNNIELMTKEEANDLLKDDFMEIKSKIDQMYTKL